MSNPLKALSARTYWALGAFTLILWFPKDWEDRADAWNVWARWLAVFDRDTLLWIFSIALLIWLVWTDVRPSIRGRLRKRFPERHAEICKKIGDVLGELRGLVVQAPQWARLRESGRSPTYIMFQGQASQAITLAGQIPYDPETGQTVRDYVQLCAIIVDSAEKQESITEDRKALDAISSPLFETLHKGQRVNRAELPLLQWMQDTGA